MIIIISAVDGRLGTDPQTKIVATAVVPGRYDVILGTTWYTGYEDTHDVCKKNKFQYSVLF